jgi:hypothetical protein
MKAGQNPLPSGKQIIILVLVGVYGQAGNLKPLNVLAVFFVWIQKMAHVIFGP